MKGWCNESLIDCQRTNLVEELGHRARGEGQVGAVRQRHSLSERASKQQANSVLNAACSRRHSES